ncbi:MAG: serine/threonine-protein phosphatase [Proteobacteria bacterium]|nr:serine/threonine-protein phosphatase [Pseudomonadota bacterium]
MDNSPQQNIFSSDEKAYLNDLKLAADFQKTVLPEIVDVDYLDIALMYEPYDVVSGDVYDFILNREKELAIFIGDATGHGISAALMTMMVHIAIDSLTPNLATDKSIRKLNQLISSRNTGRSVTSALFRIKPDGLLKVTHAGHPSLIVVPADNSQIVTFKQAGCPLGLFIEEPVQYIEETYQLMSGDKIIAYTDGLVEWRNNEKESYGLDRLLDSIKINRAADCRKLMTAIYDDVVLFSNQKRNSDDLTILISEYKNVLI